ncbi:MAG: carbohydrate binding domain-containing protein [Candidatus Omnitrophota bacterium]|nr:hypothetical protein [Candidatus Omnitrophota bacterium]
MKRVYFAFILVFLGISLSFSAEGILIDDFEASITGGPQGTVDFGSGNGSFVDVKVNKDIKYSGKQSMMVKYDSVSGGYMWIARGFGLDAKNSAWLVGPDGIAWNKVKGISLYMYGSNSGARIALDIKDSGNEIWRIMFDDNFKEWKQVTCDFVNFFARGDWQPDGADKNAVLNFPIKSYRFELRSEGKGTLYFDQVELYL